MSDILMLSIYVDKNGKMIFVPYKKTVAGYRLATEPYRTYEAGELNSVNIHIINMMSEIALDPIVEDVSKASNAMKKICGRKSFTKFSKEHICIDVRYDVQEKTYIISNSPRLSDGSYGVQKNTISQQYSSDFVCSCDDDDQVRENFLKAYAEAKKYLYAVGLSKEPAIDFGFGHKTIWIAAKDVPVNYILDNKRFTNIEQISWGKGLDVVENDNKKVFIAGPSDSWIIIVGRSLPDPSKPQRVIHLLKELSCDLKEICYFAAHRTVGCYGFARMFEGKIDRMYGYSGESGHICANIGQKSRAEQELGLNLAQKDEDLLEGKYDDICEEDILKIASLWGIKPEKLIGAREQDCHIADFVCVIS